MKTKLTILVFLVVVGLALAGTATGLLTNEESYERVEEVATTTEVVVEEVIEVDVIDAAKAELDRINAELDVEETRLIEERSEIDARLEKIAETRMSF